MGLSQRKLMEDNCKIHYLYQHVKYMVTSFLHYFLNTARKKNLNCVFKKAKNKTTVCTWYLNLYNYNRKNFDE